MRPRRRRSGSSAACGRRCSPPTAMNQQKFRFELLPDGRTVRAQASPGAYTAVDLGIAKYHFEVGAGTENFAWE